MENVTVLKSTPVLKVPPVAVSGYHDYQTELVVGFLVVRTMLLLQPSKKPNQPHVVMALPNLIMYLVDGHQEKNTWIVQIHQMLWNPCYHLEAKELLYPVIHLVNHMLPENHLCHLHVMDHPQDNQ